MPGGDGTGPNGMGGWCTLLWKSGQIDRPAGGGGRGFSGRIAQGVCGRGRGRMNMFYATPQAKEAETAKPSREQEIEHLEQESRLLQQQIEDIKQRIEELKK